MKIIFPWPSSAIRFFFKKKRKKICSWSIDTIAHNALGLKWVMIFSTKDGGAANQIRNGNWMQLTPEDQAFGN